ncbi:type II toxin-antitoxin system RelE/ParE family toxin [Candidatus Entotheonella palauensis]|uniref:type II toxin-antitoxin system RelE/ParE family toxin n=1 Tax=Candidatus Entotheonella palauensis TaxID=93172 RepID=UPI00211877BF|nr:type II toxin-antitoxin system RelE/ParE family toxin [Candidatus Entotheonella palauensis]
MLTLRWTRRALRDMRHLHDYIAARNPQAARRMVARIREATSYLCQTPRMGKPGRVSETRELSIAGTPYILVYLIDGSEIQIVAVIHVRQQWPERSDDEG